MPLISSGLLWNPSELSNDMICFHQELFKMNIPYLVLMILETPRL